MDSTELKSAYELLQEKYNRHEKILIQAYQSLKQKQDALKNLNKELSIREEELKSANHELKTINQQLFDKNEIINNQNIELNDTLNHLKEMQSRLLQAEKMASLGILTAGVAHEINNPLNYIMGACFGLENYFAENGSEDEDQTSALLNCLKIGVDKVSNIVKGLNQFSRDNKKYNEDCDIHSIVDNCLLMMNNQIKHRIQIIKEYVEGLSVIKGNVGMLHQAFLNILANASQSIEENGTIKIKTHKTQSEIFVDITDTGIGICEDNLHKITVPFFTTKEPGKGTGLGLSITYSIVQDHKGKLEFESKLGIGTTARIVLPLE